ncbi:hypothetical protein C1645_566954 [Glomus cerebriforme]|uniref:Uncharacterized protein n=1 Tax=Glomus cerebriforme TaxID=658196 RepID=A0A397T911_9GLOM|nr:hypothetical protein C1645_566954 [Glomus cerebriforme]
MRLRYFEKKDDVNDDVNDDDNVDANDDFNDDYNDDVNGDVYSDNNPTYELREARVRFQEPSDDDADENTEDSIQQKFEDIVDSDRISRIHLTNNDDNYDRIARLQIDPFESNFYEPSKFSDTNNFSDYLVSSPESPKTEEGVFYSLNNEQKDTTTSEQSSTIQDSLEESLEAKFNKLNAAEISSLSKVSEPRQFDVGEESKSDIVSSEELEKREIIEERVESVSLEAEPSEITIDSKVGVVSQQPLITREKVVTNEGDDSTNFGSLGSREPSSFGGTTFTPPAPSAFSIPPAFATQSPNVNAFNRTQPFIQPSFSQSSSIPSALNTSTFGQTGFSTPSFGQPSFGQSSSIPSALNAPTFGQTGFPAPSFGQTGFGQPTFGRVGLGQPAFGQTGMGTPGFGVPSPINTAALKTPSGGGFARFASGGSGVGFGSPSNVSTSASNKPPATASNPTWSEIRK